MFLGGPPLVKMATGEESDDEELGGAEMHSRVSGLSDYFAADELDCIRIGREIVRDLNWRKLGPAPTRRPTSRVYDAEELLGIASVDLRVPFDPREVIARIVDGSRFDEYKALYGTSLVTRLGRDPRLPGRHPGQRPRRAVQRRGEEGDRVHPPRQPDRHAAAVPPEHHRLHGRQGLRAAAGSSRTAPR